MTEPLNYATPVERAKTPLTAWIAIAIAVLSPIVDVVALYGIRQAPIAINMTSGTITGIVAIPAWVRVVQGAAILLPFVGLVLAIVALRRSTSNRSVAIAAIVANGIMLGALLALA